MEGMRKGDFCEGWDNPFFCYFRVIGVEGGWVRTGFFFYFRVIGEEVSGQRSKFLWKGWRKGLFLRRGGGKGYF